MFPDEIKNKAEQILSLKAGSIVEITALNAAGGGCINETCVLSTTNGKFFIKYNSATAFPAMFEKEAAGLQILSGTNTIEIPEIISYGESGSNAFLLLQYVESGTPGRNFWNEFGTKLAQLHGNTSAYYGLDHDNYIGSLVQSNDQNPDFFSFFITQRIEPQLKKARNKGAFSISETRYFDSLFKKLPEIIPPEKPALIHGDLWNGNYIITAKGSPCLIDPAVYYGHRESDIAMTRLFGGFHPDFYDAYNQAWPMAEDWQKRVDIFNLYPLLVHVNLFGGSYARQVLQIIRQF